MDGSCSIGFRANSEFWFQGRVVESISCCYAVRRFWESTPAMSPGVLGEASPRESHGRMCPKGPPKPKKNSIRPKRNRDDISEEHMRINRLMFFLSFKAKTEKKPSVFHCFHDGY